MTVEAGEVSVLDPTIVEVLVVVEAMLVGGAPLGWFRTANPKRVTKKIPASTIVISSTGLFTFMKQKNFVLST